MLRNEIQEKTGLSRKAIEYYEEKGLIHPKKLENGYRNYNKDDLELLIKISTFRTLGMSIAEIEKCLSDYKSLSTVIRQKENELYIDEKRKNVLSLILNGEKEEVVKKDIAEIEAQETLYEKLLRVWPGYLGQLIFASYRPFLSEILDSKNKMAFEEYIRFLDNLPEFNLSKDEKDYIEKVSFSFDMKVLNNLVESKNRAIENADKWLEENKEILARYESYQNSDAYKNSEMKKIKDKLKAFMEENKYYENAIPLIRAFSKSYNEYYEKLLRANEKYLKHKF